MANASAKRIASQNEIAIRNLQLGMIISNVLYFIIRLLHPSRSFPPSLSQLTIYILTFLPSLFLAQHLRTTGRPRRDPVTGTLISSGEDLDARGVTEWCWDVIYVTWACQVGSALLGEWFWFGYLSIPAFACWKLYTKVIGPMFLGRGGPQNTDSTEVVGEDKGTSSEGLSKRQQKMQKRERKVEQRVKHR